MIDTAPPLPPPYRGTGVLATLTDAANRMRS